MNGRIERFNWWELSISPRTRWWFVSVATASGHAGYGECSDGGARGNVESALRAARSTVVGCDAFADRDAMLSALFPADSASSARERHLAATIRSAVECALSDLAAQRDGVPLWSRYGEPAGGPATELYANINRGLRDRSPQGYARAAQSAVQAGFTTIKCAPFDDDSGNGESIASVGLGRLTAMREALGARVALLVDFHERLRLAEVIALVPKLESLEIGWIEDAVSFRRIDDLRRLKEATRIPLAGGEQALTLEELAPTWEAGVLDIVMPDVKHAGIDGALAIGRAAAAWGARVSLHNPTGPIGTAASLHVATLLPHFSLLEFCYDELPERGAVVTPSERLDRGTLPRPAAAGLGVSLALAHPLFTSLTASRG